MFDLPMTSDNFLISTIQTQYKLAFVFDHVLFQNYIVMQSEKNTYQLKSRTNSAQSLSNHFNRHRIYFRRHTL